MTLLTGQETIQALRKIAKDIPELFEGIKMSGKGRTKQVIANEMNARIKILLKRDDRPVMGVLPEDNHIDHFSRMVSHKLVRWCSTSAYLFMWVWCVWVLVVQSGFFGDDILDAWAQQIVPLYLMALIWLLFGPWGLIVFFCFKCDLLSCAL